ncbi:sigma-E factor negative regulatory protein [Pseudoxanthomonas sp. PXM02]|uniref:sigma-E factor negative regulatory protein n=1 Tax=Pseudoxanthomonas sp. PXM02 TaxID=2769294 RepID=UPI00177F7B7F|nr:sigma-E factor negative regulatory protein [Pseudoxanthomonas sp. PXM02]MBD9477855.1 sigma-E factor negative regulatory protein [Pseudoxanthomonas sp. PXM02]
MTARNETPIIDKLDIHHRQQLSALMDGDLAADEARFLLRRVQHDQELAGCWERWQLCGDVLRGQGRAPAPAGFAERVAQAIAAEATPSATAAPQASRPRSLLARWGGGALAASVALVALFMARQQSPQDVPVGEGAQVASAQATSPAVLPESPSAPAPDAEAYAAAAVAVAASVPRRQDSARRSATRSQQAARSAQRVARAEAPVRANGTTQGTPLEAVATMTASANMHAASNPFSHRAQDAGAVASRPWPRSALSAYPSASGGLTTGYSSDAAASTFYPFDPRLPSSAPVAAPVDAPRD